MDGPIEEFYFNWLCAKVLSVDFPVYYDLMHILYTTEFVWTISGDKNREEDGLELRIDFLRETKYECEEEPAWFESPCSILEMLVALAHRANFQTDLSVKYWFEVFLTNLRLDDYRRVPNSERAHIEDILFTLVWRTYDRRGHGGLFPLRRTPNDQREVELWYQFSEFLDDQGLF